MNVRSARLVANEAVFARGTRQSKPTGTATAEKSCRICVSEASRHTREEYDAVRAQPARLFVVSGHEDLIAGKVVVEESSSYPVVEKRGEERRIVQRTDPRSSERR